ncbi:MAG: SusC/RagA family TonB-linked outer membrane protein [Phycisphaerae bacterium]|nr:SusC/RagA family TonB-linked outer membrane protein [Phycisphaerae bacterium]
MLFAATSLAEAQTVTGVVRDQTTGNPIEAAQVFLEDLGIGGLTQANGQYLLLNVPTGTHTLTVQSLGYRSESVEVTVAAGQTVTRNIFVSQQALQLDEVVVTGTASASRVREIGNSVAVLDADVAEVQPINNVSDLLRGRLAGVVVQQGSGDVGTASTIKIRGSSTMRLVNDGPLVYIDGVRVSNRMESGSRDVSRIDDLDPTMIESMEVIKGPAAATLYGTEAANGVINIRTKGGGVGEAQWNFTMRQGAQWFRDAAGRTPTNYTRGPSDELREFNIFRDRPEELDVMFRTGHAQFYGLDVSGGTDAFQYFVAASASSDEGVTYNSWARRYNGRLNLSAQPTDDLTLAVNAGVGLTRIRLGGDNPYEEAVRATFPEDPDDPLRGYFRATPEAWIEQFDDRNNANRMTAGVTASHNPFDWFTHRLTFGLDLTDQLEDQLNPFLSPQSAQFFSTTAAQGGRRQNRESVVYTTFDYAASGTRDVSETVRSTTSVGFQVYTRRIEDVTADGDRFPAFGLSAVSAAGQRTGDDNLIENNTVGVYLQQQFGFNDRFFITGAIRADDNSSFGSDFDLVYYPKVSASWVVSEEGFWGVDFFDSFRLRAAYGESGQQPDGFAALRSFTTRDSPTGSSTVTPDSPGNSQLGPEVGREIEAGFDAALFGGRVSVDFTYYDQTTSNAIVSRNVAPSGGFTNQQDINIGEINNRGIELGLNARLVESDALDWDMLVNASTNRNRVTELGLAGFLQLGWTTRHTEGYPVGSMFAPKVIQADFVCADANDPACRGIDVSSMLCDNGQGVGVACNPDAWIYQGHPDPNLELSIGSSFTIGDRLTIDALAQGKFGQTKYDLQGWWRYAALQTALLNADPRNHDDITEVAEAQEGAFGEFALWVNEASFFRFREVSATYQLPGSIVEKIGSTRGSVSLSARNLGMIWTNWPEWPHHDPEVIDPSNTFSGNREPQEDSAVPPLTSLTLTIRLGM